VDFNTTRHDSAATRLEFLDGLRALAALYVVFHHAAWLTVRSDFRVSSVATKLVVDCLMYGHYAVAVFIVLSGYCLMLPVIRSSSGRIKGGFFNYIVRRARRIFPPYYAALAGTLSLFVIVPRLRSVAGDAWDRALPPFDLWTILSHVLMIHALRGAWVFRIDPPMWSVATEWYIYFLFPAFVALWRRFGATTLLVVALTVSYLPTLITRKFDHACPWYIALFAIGMGGAMVGSSDHARSCKWWWRATSGGAGWLVACFVGATAIVVGCFGEFKNERYVDLLVGSVAAVLIVHLASLCTSGLRSRVLRFFESGPMVGLGTFSYSLYLIHMPMLALASRSPPMASLGPDAQFWVMALVVVPASVLIAYGFHVVFERPFMPGHPRRLAVAAISTIRSPPP
jgi:peptidoglycan/LPS O-acetylase OafA/YrhL